MMAHFDTTQWLLFAIAVGVGVIAFCSLMTMGVIVASARYLAQRGSFSQRAQPLLDEGNLSKLIELCHARLETFHDDAHAHWYLGVALYRRGELKHALRYLNRVPELEPGWDVSRMVTRIEEELNEKDAKPDLKIIRQADEAESPFDRPPS
jgi:tetratricopeptide (TPR) repeat protein